MSNRFNPMSTGVAVATATVILGIAGCAMGTQTASTDQTDAAGLSRESTQNSQSVAQADTSTMPSTAPMGAPVTPAGQWVEPAPAAAPIPNDTAVIPSADQSTAMAAPAPAYPSTTTASTGTGMATATSADTGTNSSDQPLPPRSDRN